MEGAGGGSKKHQTVIEQGTLPSGLRGVFQPLNEAGQLFMQKLAVEGEILPSIGLLGFMGELVGGRKTDRL